MEHKVAKFGCFFGFLSIVLYYISPLYGSWWFSIILHGKSSSMSYSGDRLNAFGAIQTDYYYDQILGQYAIIGGFSTMVGSFLLLIGIISTNKGLGIAGGVLIIIGPLLFLLALYMPMVDPDVLDFYIDKGILFGVKKVSIGDDHALQLWSLGPGFYMALLAGILGIIGAVIISDYDNI